jgi:subtilase family serine protease
MRPRHLFILSLLLIFGFISLAPLRTRGQANSVRSLITQAVDETKLTTLSGNTHPLARPQYDQGAAPASLALDHMLLVLKRSPEQQAALETLLAQQQDRSSPNYHKWLTPEQFGEQFGPSDQDVQAVTAWLQSQGFQSAKVSNGRSVIDFSGDAGQVQNAFHATIHRYVMSDGTEHWANANDPQIPAALTPVVAGVNSLNNFPRKPMHHSFGVFRRSNADGKITRIKPQLTFAGGCNGTGTNCYAVGPADLATIYNIPSTTTGAGQTIAIVSDSDISLPDLTAFRSLFGLPAATFNQIETGADPGMEFNINNSDEEEAALDAEWSGAVAPSATIDLVVSPTTNTTFGGDTSASYIINCQAAGPNCTAGAVKASILSYSYGNCELALGTAGNAFYSSLWSQAALEGITVLVASGDEGSAGCDDPNIDSPAQVGLAVTGEASTPYNVAVGGTDFNDFTVAQANTYWNTTNNGTTQASAKGYIPETTYNDTCTNSILFAPNGVFPFSNFANGELACNSPTVQQYLFIGPTGGSGGISNCTSNSTTSTSTTLAVSSCSGGYPKPSWQTGPGVPNDGKRDLPDVSLFAGDSTIQNFYIVCESDLAAADAGTGLQACSLASPFQDFVGEGGTSVSTQVFAGIMALIDQKFGAQGNANPTLYALAAEQSASSCNASAPASTCVFNDVTVGTNAMPCVKGTPNCTVAFSNDTIGVLSGYNAGTGYDLATGLGSINVGNLLAKFGPNFSLFSANPAVTISSPGASGTLSVTATSVNRFSGTVALACSGLPTGATCTFSPASPLTLSAAGTATTTVTVNTTSASRVLPANRPSSPGGWTTTAEVTLFLVLCVGLLLIGPRENGRRWSTAASVTVLAILIGIAACGGGSSSSSSSGTTGTTGTTTATVTGTSSSGAAFSMNFAVTIQ